MLITLSEMTQNLKIRAHLMQNSMELDIKKLSDPKALTLGVWDLKTSLWQFGHKAFGKRTYQGISREPYLQFSQTRPHFFKNHEMNPIKS